MPERAATLAGRIAAAADRIWREPGGASAALRPLAALYGAATELRRSLYRRGVFAVHHVPARVVVVGNLVAGGAGKTPTVIAVVAALQAAGHVPGIVSRGYGRSSDADRVVAVEPSTDPARAGDEPLLLRRRTGVPVFVGADRVAAAHALLQAHPAVDVVVADDGLQHLALGRDVEVVVFDERGLGNGRLLPAGPLRERPAAALPDAPARLVLYNAVTPTAALPGFTSTRALAGVAALDAWHAGAPPSRDALHALRGRRVVAAAGVARPGRFFGLLRDEGLDIAELPLPDHHDFAALPWPSTAGDVVVTEKDAVKLGVGRKLAARVWVATLDFEPEPAFATALLAALDARSPVEPIASAPPNGNPPA